MIGVLSSAQRLNALTLIKCKQCNGFLSIQHISQGGLWCTQQLSHRKSCGKHQ